MTIAFELNGEPVRVESVDPHLSLLHWLRAQGLTGTKEGCAEGECGACAVALRRVDSEGVERYVPINSCLLPVAEAGGKSFITVEHLSNRGQLHPVQQAMVEQGGSQCGYCTPGFIMSLFCEYYRPDREGYDPESISGNLCRCTGYRPIADVAKGMKKPEQNDPFLLALSTKKQDPKEPRWAPAVGAQPPAQFFHPAALPELFETLKQHPSAMLLAGGTDMMVPCNQRNVRYHAVVFVDQLAELHGMCFGETEVSFGAAVPLAEIERVLNGNQEHLPMLHELLPLFSSRLIRNRATLGGNLGTASPIGDSPPALLALDAELTLASADGERRVPLSQFFVGYRKTVLAPGEIITRVHIPKPFPTIQRFYKVSKRVMDDISTVAAGFALELDSSGNVSRLRIAYGGVAATPIRAQAAEKLALNKPWNAETLSQLLTALGPVGTPMDDHRGSAKYRRAMIGKLLERFFHESQQIAVAAE